LKETENWETMEQKDNRPFSIYDWQVSPTEGVLSRDDQTVRLEPKAMEVLVYLAARPGEVITREDLERDVWHGALVGYDAVTNTIIKLRKALQDDARQPRYIATIPKKGYQLIADISWFDDAIPRIQERHATPASLAPESKADHLTRLKFPRGVLLLAFVIVAGLLVLVWFGTGDNKQVSEYPSIVVLPFVNLSDDPRQAYLADGITEDITTDLSRMSSLRVLAGNTALKYKGKQVTPEQVGNELKVKFVLKGSIRQSGGKLRVNAQLVNTATGFNVWAQRYDRKLAELFAVQDEVTQNIVNALAVKLTRQEKQRLARRPTDSLMAYDYFQEGQRLYKTNTIESSRQASDMYRKAIELDPEYGRAYGAYAVNLAMVYRRGWSDSPNATLDRALTLANKAVKLDDSIPQTYWALGFVHLARKDFDKAEQSAIKSIDIAPNYADGYGLLALINSYTRRPEQAIELTNKAISLNPYYSYEYLINYGIAYYIQGNFTEAIKVLERGHERNPNHMVINLILSASYLRAKRQDDAEWLVNEMLVLSPNLDLATVANNIPFDDKQTVQQLVDDLRTAGLPE
jgi:TolB-like protein/DNA-binding winged helix-turn-helix (wHTH) protein/Flp pilus assembly protein TadD